MKKQSWWQLLSIQAGGTLCLPVIIVGQLIYQKFGWLAALLSLGIGNLFLLGIGLIFCSLSTATRQTTVENAASYFGDKGRVFFSSVMMVAMLGWFGIQLNVMSLSLGSLLAMIGITVSPLLLTIGLGAILSGVMCLGMKAMKWLSNIALPLMACTLLGAFFLASGTLPAVVPLSMSLLGGVSFVIGANIAAVIDLPTFFRYARSKKDARICILLLYGLITPLIEGVGVFLSALSGGGSVLTVLQMGGGVLWGIWVSLFILFAGWTTNNTNLYSAIASSYSLPMKLNPLLRTLVLGGVGILMACLNPLANIGVFLNLIGISIGGMGAVMMTNYLGGSRQGRAPFVSWLLGFIVGVSSSVFGLFITGVPVFDAFIVSALSQYILNRGVYEKIRSE